MQRTGPGTVARVADERLLLLVAIVGRAEQILTDAQQMLLQERRGAAERDDTRGRLLHGSGEVRVVLVEHTLLPELALLLLRRRDATKTRCGRGGLACKGATGVFRGWRVEEPLGAESQCV